VEHYTVVEKRNTTILRKRILQSGTQSINTDAPHAASATGQPTDDSGLSHLPENQENWEIGGDCYPETQPDANNNTRTGSPLLEGISEIDIDNNDDVDMFPMDVDVFPMDLEDTINNSVGVPEGDDMGPVPLEGDPLLPNDPSEFMQDLPPEEYYNPYRDADENDESEDEKLDDYRPPEFDTPEPIGVPETVEINTDEEDDADPSCVEVFPRAGEVLERRQPRYAENVHNHMKNATRSVYYPFRDFQEFDLAIWLNELPLSKVDSFLQRPWVSSDSSMFTRF
jgi:hypothetical protein